MRIEHNHETFFSVYECTRLKLILISIDNSYASMLSFTNARTRAETFNASHRCVEAILRRSQNILHSFPFVSVCRSPSPEPIYSSDGKRLNTREFRTRKRLEEQRHQLITRMLCINPDFKPPSDYK